MRSRATIHRGVSCVPSSSVTKGRSVTIDAMPNPVPFKPYHGKDSNAARIAPQDRKFIAWDGEGVNLDGPNFPQSYTLFGCSTGERIKSGTHLHTFELLDFIIRVGKANPTAWHVGFAFNYDSNMLLRSLSEGAIKRIHQTGKLSLVKKSTGDRFHIQFIPGKWFSVTKYNAGYHRKSNPHAKTTVKINDIFSFFGTSFIKAYTDLVGEVPAVVRDGKASRNDFASLSAEYVEIYWRAEIEMLRELADELRNRMYGANLRIRQWHGPGALASYANHEHNIREAMAQCPDPVREAARYAYAGGRFERYKLGRTVGRIYSLDINSAYPHAIRQLPNLTTGEWRRVESPERLARFGVYRVRLLPHKGDSFLERRPGPLFHRDKMGNISFPWVVDGWFWAPEVANLVKWLDHSRYVIEEGWEYVNWNVKGLDNVRPFAWVEDTYKLRQQWKKQGNASQLALKLLMNSLYGKMAQRVGWNEEHRTAPSWHQLEWAGWVTSYCRAMLWDAMQSGEAIQPGSTIAVETDGLYTTVPPTRILSDNYRNTLFDSKCDAGPSNREYLSSTELGGWEIDEYDEIIYVQSGLAWLRSGNKWICKRRGLDAKTFELDACRDYVRTLGPRSDWLPYTGRTTRFIGMGAAFNSASPFKQRHCVWESVDRVINPGTTGKRVHIWRQCQACTAGATAYEQPHDMTIRSLAYSNPQSYPHDIPWENGDQGYEHRKSHDIGEPNAYALD